MDVDIPGHKFLSNGFEGSCECDVYGTVTFVRALDAQSEHEAAICALGRVPRSDFDYDLVIRLTDQEFRRAYLEVKAVRELQEKILLDNLDPDN